MFWRESGFFKRMLCFVVTVTGRPVALMVLQLERRVGTLKDIRGRVDRWPVSGTTVSGVCPRRWQMNLNLVGSCT